MAALNLLVRGLFVDAPKKRPGYFEETAGQIRDVRRRWDSMGFAERVVAMAAMGRMANTCWRMYHNDYPTSRTFFAVNGAGEFVEHGRLKQLHDAMMKNGTF